ncbi:hypothetical protein MHYP_G00050860 [Metynnis hypsauchen]
MLNSNASQTKPTYKLYSWSLISLKQTLKKDESDIKYKPTKEETFDSNGLSLMVYLCTWVERPPTVLQMSLQIRSSTSAKLSRRRPFDVLSSSGGSRLARLCCPQTATPASTLTGPVFGGKSSSVWTLLLDLCALPCVTGTWTNLRLWLAAWRLEMTWQEERGVGGKSPQVPSVLPECKGEVHFHCPD